MSEEMKKYVLAIETKNTSPIPNLQLPITWFTWVPVYSHNVCYLGNTWYTH